MIYNELTQRGTDDFPIELYHIDKNHTRYEMTAHWHSEVELIRVLKGQLRCKFNNQNYLAQKGDVLVNSLGQGTLGRIHLYKETKNNVIVDQFITILRTTSFVKSIYLYLLLNTDIYQNVIESNITGSTGMWVLTINNIRRIKIVQPHDCEFEKIESYFSSIYNSISANNAEIERLSTLRDTLLPRLMSGELKINEINC